MNSKANKYHVLKACDKSACSSAYITLNTQSDRISVLKIFNNASQITPQRAYHDELEIFKSLEAAHIDVIPKLHIASTEIGDVEHITPNRNFYGFLELELGEFGDLLDIVIKYKELEGRLGLPEHLAKFFFTQIIDGLEAFHQAKFVHRDIKPHNMIITNKLELKFIDFGFTTKVNDDGIITGNKGTPGYKAPETKSFAPYDGFKADIYAAGICLFLMVAPETQLKDLNGRVSEDCVELIRSMINQNPNRRPSLAEIRKHKWLDGPRLDAQTARECFKAFWDKIWLFNEKNISSSFVCSGEIKDLVLHKIYIREKNIEMSRRKRSKEEKPMTKTEEDIDSASEDELSSSNNKPEEGSPIIRKIKTRSTCDEVITIDPKKCSQAEEY